MNPFDQGYYTSKDLSEYGFKHIGENVQIARNCTIIGLENISIANNVRVDGGTTFACKSGSLTIGNYTHIGSGSFLACGAGITLNDFCGLSQGVKIYSVSDDYSGKSLTNPTVPKEFLNVKARSVTLHRHVIVGSGSVILPGCDIGEGTSVGALSLINKCLEEWSIYAGVPAKRLKSRSRKILEIEKHFLCET